MFTRLAAPRSSRLVIWLVSALLLAMWWVPRAATSAFAAGSPGGFEIDGNAVSNGQTDWDTVKTTPDRRDNVPSDGTVLSASSKEDQLPKDWTPSGSPPTKVDVINTWVYSHNVGTTPYVDFAWTRSGDIGTGGFYLELNKLANYVPGQVNDVPQRSDGDVRFQIKATGNDTLALTDVSTWSGSATSGSWVADPSFNASGFDYAVNSAPVTPPGSPTVTANSFVEVSLDLKTLLGLSPSCPPAFGTVNFRAYTGNSDKNLEDFIKGIPASSGSTCGTLTIDKKDATSGVLAGGATFRISPDPTPPGGGAGSHLDVTDTDGDGVVTVDPVVPGTYSVQETGAPAGYTVAVPDTQSGLAVDPSGSLTVTFRDPRSLVDITVKKVAAADANTVLAGAHFTLHEVVPGDDTVVDSCITGVGGTCTVQAEWGHTYYWVETQAPPGYNLPDDAVGDQFTVGQGDVADGVTTTFVDDTSAIDTDAADATIGAAVSDTASLSHVRAAATGTITFGLYGPFPAGSTPTAGSCTADTLVTTLESDAVDGPGSYGSGSYTPDQAGDYYWVAAYSGDKDGQGNWLDVPVSGTCGDAGETSHVGQATPTMTTQATSAAVLPTIGLPGGTAPSIQDVATLAGATADATGTVSFALYGPSAEADCSGTPVFTSADRPLTGGVATSEAFVPTAVGHYWWTAHYTGDTNNTAAGEACGAPNEDTTVSQADVTLAKDADPAPGTVMQPGDRIDYAVSVTNSGDAPATGVTVVDTLPAHVTPAVGSISDGGTYDAAAGTITWTVDVAAGSVATLTYEVRVDADAPQGSVLHNVATMGDQQASTDHPVAAGGLALVKSVAPTEDVEYGDTLTYTLVASATGTLDQHAVVVSDVVPDHTTYVDGSAACTGPGSCLTSYDAATGTLTWVLGPMAHGTSRGVSFQVTVDTPADTGNGLPSVTIVNVGHVHSVETPNTPSNQVVTIVTAVLGEKHERPTPTLPFTGAPVALLGWAALALLAAGLASLLAGRRRRT